MVLAKAHGRVVRGLGGIGLAAPGPFLGRSVFPARGPALVAAAFAPAAVTAAFVAARRRAVTGRAVATGRGAAGGGGGALRILLAEQGLAGELHAVLVVDRDDLDLEPVAELDHVLDPADVLVVQLGDVAEA